MALEADHRRRLKAFASDRDGAKGIEMPGWRRFAQIVGAGLPQRELFVQMSLAEPALMRSEPNSAEPEPQAPADPDDVRANSRSATFNARCALNLEGSRGAAGRGTPKVSAAGVAALLFASVDKRIEASDRSLYYLQQLAYHQVMRQAMATDGDRSKLFRTLLGDFIARTAERADAFQGVRLALFYDLPEGLKPSLVMVGRPINSPQTFVYGVLGVARFGGRQDAKALAPLLKSDATYRVQTNNAVNEVYVRDIALAAIIHLHGEDPKKWGFSQRQENAQTVYDPNSLVFSSNEQREAAHKRWQERADSK